MTEQNIPQEKFEKNWFQQIPVKTENNIFLTNLPLYHLLNPSQELIINFLNQLKGSNLYLIVGAGHFIADEMLKAMLRNPGYNVISVEPRPPNFPQETDVPMNLLKQISHTHNTKGINLPLNLQNLPELEIFLQGELVSPHPPIEVFLIREVLKRLKPEGEIEIIVPEDMIHVPYEEKFCSYEEILRKLGLNNISSSFLDENNPLSPRSYLFGKYQLSEEDLLEEIENKPKKGVIIKGKKI